MLERYLKLVGERGLNGYRPQQSPSKFDNIIIAMSSGVDSSVAASIYSAKYPNVRGIYMQNWSESQSLSDPQKEPCYEKDWKDICRVAKHINIPVERVNFESDYWIDVFEPMLQEYSRGLTPNPDLGCNRFVKFGKLVRHLDKKYGKNNYWLVTGHYARVLEVDQPSFEEFHLLRSFYEQKDQSYYLSQINPNILPRLLFPIGHVTKPEVREMARAYDLPTATKPDSQGICFVNNSQHGKFKNFLEHYIPPKRGNIITIDSITGERKIWGQHEGLWSYTIGQKVGIAMPQGDPKYKGTWFVSDKLHDTNEIVIVKDGNNPALYKDKILVQDFITMLNKKSLDLSCNLDKLTIQYRSLQEPILIRELRQTESGVEIFLENKQRAMAPGQYCCIYLGNRVLGSGPISKVY